MTFAPRVIAQMHGNQVKLAKFSRKFIWHDHTEAAALFLMVPSVMRSEFRD